MATIDNILASLYADTAAAGNREIFSDLPEYADCIFLLDDQSDQLIARDATGIFDRWEVTPIQAAAVAALNEG